MFEKENKPSHIEVTFHCHGCIFTANWKLVNGGHCRVACALAFSAKAAEFASGNICK